MRAALALLAISINIYLVRDSKRERCARIHGHDMKLLWLGFRKMRSKRVGVVRCCRMPNREAPPPLLVQPFYGISAAAAAAENFCPASRHMRANVCMYISSIYVCSINDIRFML